VILTPISLLHTGLRFEEILDAEVWHGDVRVFSVFDLSSRELFGYFYQDIYARLVLLKYVFLKSNFQLLIYYWFV